MRIEHWHALGAAALLLAAAGLAWFGQPDPARRWAYLAPQLEPRLTKREVQIDPAELLELMHNDYIDLHLVDVRDERDWNLFHLWGAERITPDELPAYHQRFAQLPANGVIVLMSNDEAKANEAWKLLMATASRPNAYILAGGINRWLAEFTPGQAAGQDAVPDEADETLRHPPPWALGSRHPAALPELHHETEAKRLVRKVRLQQRVTKKGGCG